MPTSNSVHSGLVLFMKDTCEPSLDLSQDKADYFLEYKFGIHQVCNYDA